MNIQVIRSYIDENTGIRNVTDMIAALTKQNMNFHIDITDTCDFPVS